MSELDALLKKAAAENRKAEVKAAKTKRTPAEVQAAADFLKRWSKKKPIIRQDSDSTYWAAGKWMTKLDYGMVQAIADAKLATLTGDPKLKGARLTFNL